MSANESGCNFILLPSAFILSALVVYNQRQMMRKRGVTLTDGRSTNCVGGGDSSTGEHQRTPT